MFDSALLELARHPSPVRASLAMKGEIREADWRRLYLIQHPLAIAVSIGMAITGALLLVSPPLFAHTVIAQALPAGLEYPWDVTLMLGGVLSLLGFYKLDARPEIAGMILIATALFVWAFIYVAVTSADNRLFAATPIALCVSTGVGCTIRAFALITEPEVRAWQRRRSS